MSKLEYINPADLAEQMIYLYDDKEGAWSKYRVDWQQPDRIIATWVTGGMSGGSCWGDRADRNVSPEKPLDVTEVLAYWMMRNTPDVTFLVYNDIVTDSETISVSDDGTHYEYYGNYTTRDRTTLNVTKLVAKLIEHGIMEEQV